MLKNNYCKLIAYLLSIIVAVVFTLSGPLKNIDFSFLKAYAETGTVNTDRLNVRSGPGTNYSKNGTISLNTPVNINSSTTGDDGYVWYQISYSGGSGYVRSDYIYVNQVYYASDGDFENYLTSQGFPESYKNGLRGLHEQYPNWIFEAQHTGLDWNSVLSGETVIGKSLVSSTSISSWKSIQEGAFDWANNYWPGFDGSSWVQASEALVAHYLDPRNFLQDPYIFQFEIQYYDPSIQTREGLVTMLQGTFLEGDAIVPVADSKISGGTIIPGSTYTPGQSASSGDLGSGASSSSYGPGGSSGSSVNSDSSGSSGSSSDVEFVGPGFSLNSDSTTYSKGDIILTEPISIASFVDDFIGTINSFAAGWVSEDSSTGRIWRYVNDDGTNLNSGWYWLDGNLDGIAECYYFYSDGTMAASTYVDTWLVDSEGRWVENGVIQTRSSDISQGSSGVSGELKSVPYADIIMEAAAESQVSPYVIAATILQEQGSGTSDLISGENSSYPGVYNFFNIGAYAHDGMGVVEAGLNYASGQGWTSIEKSIIGGASEYGSNYVSRGQDTYYLKKFNVQGNNLYNHQYMTHVIAAAAEGGRVSSAYGSLKNSVLRFKIPVYNNMPETPCELPQGDGSPNNKLQNLYVDGFSLTPTFDMDTETYSLIVDGSVASINVTAVTIDSGASVSDAGKVNLVSGLNYIDINVTAENGTVRTYRINVTRRDNTGSGNTSSSTTGSSQGSNVSVGPGGTTETSTSNAPSGSVVIGQGPLS